MEENEHYFLIWWVTAVIGKYSLLYHTHFWMHIKRFCIIQLLNLSFLQNKSINSFKSENLRWWHKISVPVVIAAHLLHDLAVDLVPERLVFSGGAKDLVSELQGTLHLLGGVISHIFQDRYTTVKEEKLSYFHSLWKRSAWPDVARWWCYRWKIKSSRKLNRWNR